MIAALVPLVVLLPLIGAAAALILGRHRHAQMAVGIGVLSMVAVIAAVLLIAIDDGEPVVVDVGGWERRSASCSSSTGCRRSCS